MCAARKQLLLVAVALCFAALAIDKTIATIESEAVNESATKASDQQDLQELTSKSLPANHRMESPEAAVDTATGEARSVPSARAGRQYDANSLSASGTGTYAAISGDTGASYGLGSPLSGGAGYAAVGATSGGGGSNYLNDYSLPNGYPSNNAGGGLYAHEHMSGIARGYTQPPPPMGPPHMGGPFSSMFAPSLSSSFSPGGPMFPLMSKGFDVAEIVCTAVAVAIGAVIIGAPFVLLYLFVMSQVNGGNGGPNIGPSGGAISLTGPTSSTNVSGRKKRQTSFPEALLRQLSPLMNNEQVANTFKMLMNSIAKYQP